MWVTVICKKITNCINHSLKYIFQVLFNIDTSETFLKRVRFVKNSKENLEKKRVKSLFNGCRHNDCNLLWCLYLYPINLITLSKQISLETWLELVNILKGQQADMPQHGSWSEGDLLQQYCTAAWCIPDRHPWLIADWPQATDHLFGTLSTIDEGCSLC